MRNTVFKTDQATDDAVKRLQAKGVPPETIAELWTKAGHPRTPQQVAVLEAGPESVAFLRPSRRKVLAGLLAAAATGGCPPTQSNVPAEPEASQPTRVTPLAPQTAAPPMALAGDVLAVIAGALLRVGGAALEVHEPKGLAALADGFVVLDAPAPGQVRARRVSATGQAGPDYVGVVTVPAAARAFVLSGATPDALQIVSWESRAAVSRVRLVDGRLALEGLATFAPRDPPCLADLGGGAWVRLDAGGLALRRPDGTETVHALPDDARGIVHLADAGGGRLFASLSDGGLAILALGDPVKLERRVPIAAPVHHLAARGGVAAALLLDQDPSIGRQRFLLARVDGQGEVRWQIEVAPPAPAGDLWVALSDRRVVVGGARGQSSFDPGTGAPR